MPNLGPYDQYLFAAVVLLGTIGAMLALLWLTQRSRYSTRIRGFRGIAQNFMSVISVLFALNVAFLARLSPSLAFSDAGFVSSLGCVRACRVSPLVGGGWWCVIGLLVGGIG